MTSVDQEYADDNRILQTVQTRPEASAPDGSTDGRLPMTLPVRLVAPDGVEIVDPGVRPAGKGTRGTPARGRDRSKRCVNCLNLLAPDRGRSPYCADCAAEAVRRSWQQRNDKRRSASTQRHLLQQEPHWEGNGYTYGRRGLYLDTTLVQDLREAVQGLLTAHVTWAGIAAEPHSPERGRQYHQALKDILTVIADANDVLRGPLWPQTDRRARRSAE